LIPMARKGGNHISRRAGVTKGSRRIHLGISMIYTILLASSSRATLRVVCYACAKVYFT
jgi:hypothetical protein